MLRRVLRAGGAGGLASQSSNTGPTPGVEEEQDNGVQPQEDDGYRNSISNNSKVDDRADSSSRPQQQLIFILERTTAGRWLDLLDATVNLSFVGIYIYSTFAAGSPSEAGRTPDGSDVNWIDMTVAALLLSLWLFRAYFSMDPLRKFISTFGLMNLLAELPPLIRPLVVTPAEHQNPTFMDAGRLVLLYPFRFWRLHISLMLCVQPGRNMILKFTLITQKIINIGLSIFGTLLTVTSWVHLLETMQSIHVGFFDVFYFITVTSTQGLNTQILPDSLESRIVILYVMIIGAIFLPTALADLLSLISKKSSFDSRFRPRLGIKHVVLMGQLDFKTVKEFLVELFHPDHGKLSSTIRLVILNPSEPNDDIKSLLTDHPFSSRIQYVKGQEISFHSLNKIVFHQASACFILSSKYGADDRDPRIIDAETVMRVLSLKKYDSAVPLYVQVQLPSNRIHFRHLAEHVVCVEEIKLGLLAANVVAPGFATIIYLLTTSSVSASGSNGGGGDTGSRVNWQEEYLHSASQEIYPVTFGAAFAGVPFWKAAKLIYGKFKAILFAVSLATTPSGFRKILINPSFHHIKNKDVGFIIASDSSVAESVERSWLRLEESEIEEDWMDVVNTLDFQDHSIMNLQRTQPLNVIVAPQAGSSSSSLSGFGSKNGSPMGSLRESLVLMSGGSGSNKGSKIHQSTIVKLSPPLARNALLKGKVKETPKHTSFVVGEDAVQGEEEMDESNLSTPRPSALSKAVTVLSLQNHLLICDFSHEEFPSAILYHLVAPLKARQPDLAIVILCPSSPSSQDQQQILLLNQTSSSSSATTSYSNVFTVQGSPLDRVDLDRANVQSASHVVVLSSSRMESGSFQTADSGQLVAVLNIESLNKLVDLFITVDLQHAENMRFIGGKKSITTIGNDNKIIPAFAAGHVFSHSMLNSILAQTYYNPSFLDILTRLLLIEEGDDHQEVQNHTPKEFRSVQHLSVPHRFVGCTYGQWVDFLLHHKQIPLGLYRQCLVEFNHYALVNPRNETILNVHDRAYVLRSGI